MKVNDMMRRYFPLSSSSPRSLRYSLLLALLLLAAAAAVAVGLTQAQSANGVYDTDGDGLVEISNLAQLDAIRYDLDGDGSPDDGSGEAPYAAAFSTSGGEAVCETGCSGYELVDNLDFGTTDLSRNWLPIGDSGNQFTATFEGNGHTISNLRIDRPNSDFVGLFGLIGDGGAIHRVGLESVGIAGRNQVGSLAGYNNGGSIGGSYAKGSVTATGGETGGLVGRNINNGTITASYAAAYVSGIKLKPRWDVHLPGVVNQAGSLAEVPRPLTGGASGSAVSPLLSDGPILPGTRRPSPALPLCFPGTDCL